MAIKKSKTAFLPGNSEDERLPETRLLVAMASSYTLDELLAGISPSNLHEEIDWGPAIGDEFW